MQQAGAPVHTGQSQQMRAEAALSFWSCQDVPHACLKLVEEKLEVAWCLGAEQLPQKDRVAEQMLQPAVLLCWALSSWQCLLLVSYRQHPGKCC